jgi:hypothetical protein
MATSRFAEPPVNVAAMAHQPGTDPTAKYQSQVNPNIKFNHGMFPLSWQHCYILTSLIVFDLSP